MKSLVISIIRYCCPLLINSNINLISKLQTQLMKCTRYILGYKSFKMTTSSIMRELKFLTIHSMITSESILYIHKVIYNSSPTSIHKYISYRKTDTVRTAKKPRIINHTNSPKLKNSLLHRSIYIYSLLEYDIKQYNPKKLSQYLKENITFIFPHNKITKDENT